MSPEELNTFKKDVVNDFELLLGGLGLIAVPGLLNQLNTKVPSKADIQAATSAAVCDSTKGSGCINANLGNPLNKKLDDIISAINIGGNAANLATSTNILNRVTDIQNKVNSSTFGLEAISNFAQKAWSNTKLDKVLNVLNTVLALHNALMLSRNLAQTLGDVATQALQFLNIKDADGETIDVNSFIGNTINTWITNLVGAEKYATIQETWINLNRIMVAAQGIVYAVQGIKFAVLEAIETVGNWTAKIGNNMMIQGLLEERSFPWMNENINFKNPFSGFLQKLDTADEVVSQVNNLVSSGIEAQENFNEIFEQSNEFKTASEELQQSLADFDTEKEQNEQTEIANSQSPEIDRLDLIQLEIDEIEE